ncbi:MAG: methylenetetrahydrofolate reductase [NAD(P)H] [Chitinophagales bacterium]|nr:methylenetetrahydrofolate reductase [NAD(P)H] [Chitinophagales bacterium]MDW8428617.1 methylenetetrahydrofolate reductase [NAD(P)H] [Chitinophagales bacterium]
MKVTEHIARRKGTLLSFEILPPLKGRSIQSIYDTLDPLMDFRPSFINVTYHRAEYIYRKNADGLFEKVFVRKRPGTVGICAAIVNRYQVDAVPHMVCGGFTKEETEDALIDLAYLGINNLLVVRGDPERSERVFEPEPGGHRYAIELLRQVVNMNRGIYLEEDLTDVQPTDFCIGVAGYPEKHYEAPNMKTDLFYLKAKVDAGAHYIVTQMFFDNRHYFSFVEQCRAMGITVPIIPGIKPITTRQQISTLPRQFHIELPADLVDALLKTHTDAEARQVGKEWAIQQCRELLRADVPVLHFYTMSNPKPIVEIVKALF